VDKAKRKVIFGETGMVKHRFPEPVEFRGMVTGRLYFTRKPGQAVVMDVRDMERARKLKLQSEPDGGLEK